jgi:hypothetical protein
MVPIFQVETEFGTFNYAEVLDALEDIDCGSVLIFDEGLRTWLSVQRVISHIPMDRRAAFEKDVMFDEFKANLEQIVHDILCINCSSRHERFTPISGRANWRLLIASTLTLLTALTAERKETTANTLETTSAHVVGVATSN